MSVDLFNLVLAAKLTKGGGGGGDIDVDALTVTENGVYSASSGHAYSPVTVSVPTSGITPVGTKDISSNGLYDVTNFSQASVSVPIPSGYIVPTGTSTITANGVYDITNFASASVSVPSGGIVPTGTKNIVENGIYDVTNFASASVSVPATLPSISALTVTENGTYSVPAGVDGFNPVTVNVSGGGGGDTSVEDGIIERTISQIYNSRVSKIGGYAFYGCASLTTVSFPNVTSIGTSAFYNCMQLTKVSFLNVTSIGGNAFNGCASLKSLYVLASSVATLAGTNAFMNTPISKSSYLGYFGSIYVPASLVDSYKTTGNWGVYSDRITSYVE